MAKHLARIHGTEEDKVNCPFYYKIGACRHGDRCSRLHNKPAFSPTLLIKHIYRHPNRTGTTTATVDPATALEEFLVFYEDWYLELSKFGHIEYRGLNVVDNVGDHMIGHTYVKFTDEEEAADALEQLQGRYYDGILLDVEYSPVTDFREARCRDFDEGTCSRSGFCNFLHCKPVPDALIRSLEEDAEEYRLITSSSSRRHRPEDDHDNHNNHDDSGEKRSSSSKHRSKKRKREKKEHKRHKRSRRSRSRSPSTSDASYSE
jgi:splicing factor U2AF subunit